MILLLKTIYWEYLTELDLADNIDDKQISISNTYDIKCNELRQELKQHEQQLQKVKYKEAELKEKEKQVANYFNSSFIIVFFFDKWTTNKYSKTT